MEVIIYLAFSGLLLMAAGRVSIYNNLNSQNIIKTSEISMEGENALAYIEDEIRQANYISVDRWNRDKGLGFILKKVESSMKDNTYVHTYTYIWYKYDPFSRSIIRLAYKSNLEDYDPNKSSDKLGNTTIIENVASISGSEYKVENQLIKLKLELEVDDKRVTSERFISLKKGMNSNEKF